MQITRKRISDSLRRSSTVVCSVCDGRGTVKTHETITHDIYQKIIEMDKSYLRNKMIEVTVDENLFNYINGYQKNNVNKLKKQAYLDSLIFKKSIKLNHGQFNIIVKQKEEVAIKDISFKNTTSKDDKNNIDLDETITIPPVDEIKKKLTKKTIKAKATKPVKKIVNKKVAVKKETSKKIINKKAVAKKTKVIKKTKNKKNSEEKK
jgi:hypothetical protein